MWKTLIIRALFALAIPASAAIGASILVLHPEAHTAFCEGKE